MIKPRFRKGGRSEAQKSPQDMAKHSDDRRWRSHPYGEEEGASRAIDGGNFQAAVDHTCEIWVKYLFVALILFPMHNIYADSPIIARNNTSESLYCKVSPGYCKLIDRLMPFYEPNEHSEILSRWSLNMRVVPSLDSDSYFLYLEENEKGISARFKMIEPNIWNIFSEAKKPIDYDSMIWKFIIKSYAFDTKNCKSLNTIIKDLKNISINPLQYYNYIQVDGKQYQILISTFQEEIFLDLCFNHDFVKWADKSIKMLMKCAENLDKQGKVKEKQK